jgi:hypothetical protein
VLLAVAVGGRAARLLGLVAYAVLAGLAVTAIVQYWLGALPGDYLANAAVVGLLALAMAAAVAGLGTLLGAGGIVLAVLVVFLLGNPLSGLTSAPELLPQPWGAVGQLLPPGASGTLLRSVAFFDGAGAATPAWVLGAWAAGGLLLAAATAGSRLRLPAGAHAGSGEPGGPAALRTPPDPGRSAARRDPTRRRRAAAYPRRRRGSASAWVGSRPARRRLSLSRNSICALTLRSSSAAQRSSSSYSRRSMRSG